MCWGTDKRSRREEACVNIFRDSRKGSQEAEVGEILLLDWLLLQ